jgi:hypothetical protein
MICYIFLNMDNIKFVPLANSQENEDKDIEIKEDFE